MVASGPSDAAAVWGELLSTGAARAARLARTDGLIRDTAQMAALGFPVFAAGTSPRISTAGSTSTAHGVEVTIGGVAVTTGDTVVADDDGVVVVPAAVAADALERAAAKARGEDDFARAVAGGASATEAFRRFDVL